jgi:hypothetical protein
MISELLNAVILLKKTSQMKIPFPYAEYAENKKGSHL